MKTTPHLFLAAALAFGTSLATAQDGDKPKLPPGAPPEAPGRPPSEPGRPNPPQSPERERMRDGNDRRGQQDDRPGQRERQEGPRGDKDGQRDGQDNKPGDRNRGPENRGPENRGPENRGPENRGPENRGPENRGPENRGPDNRGAENRGPQNQQQRMPMSPPMPPPAPPKPTSYIGVATVPPPPVISAQFGLPPGFGLVVTEVLPDSPAAKAGLQKHDVLTKFNDQQLVDGSQFSTLVRAQAKDSDGTLTLFRKTQEQKVIVKIGEKMMPEPRPMQMPMMGQFPQGMEQWKGPAMEHMKKFQDRAKDYGNKMREFQERMKDWSRKPTAEMPQPPQFEGGETLHLNSGDVLREVRPGGSPAVTLLQGDSAVTYRTRDAKLLMKDESGETELSTKDGRRQLVAKNAQGETVFEGPIDTEEQRAALPEELRKKVEMIIAQSRIVRFDAPAFVPAEIESNVQ